MRLSSGPSAHVLAVATLLAVLRPDAHAGGSGLNVAVVVNQASPDSVELGNYYCERRGVPPGNLVRIQWAGGNTSWTLADYEAHLFNPLQAAISDRNLSSQIRYVLLSMDIPFAVSDAGKVNSTTSTLFYGFKATTKSNENSYAASEGAFGEVVPDTATGPSYLATMVTAGTLEQAKHLVDQGVASDGMFPTQAVLLAKSSDPVRNLRHREFDHAIFSTRLAGYDTVRRIESDVVAGRSDLLGYQTGLAVFSISPNTFVPGAIADSMTSYGGVIFGPNGQTSLLAFIHAGASGSYGTVTEPGAVQSKFPDPLVYFYQARGFSLAECYYQSVAAPYQGLIVGEPLAAPYGSPASGAWIGIASNAVLSGTEQLSVSFQSAADRPLHRVDLFVDGVFFQTVTNLGPTPGNRLTANFTGGTARHEVPAGATLAGVAAGLAHAINLMTLSNLANVTATAYGDRIEVRSRAGERPAPPRTLGVAAGPPAGGSPGGWATALAESDRGTGDRHTTFLVAARDASLESTALGSRACLFSGTPAVGSRLELNVTKTSGATVRVAVTNQSSSATLLSFTSELVSAVNTAPALQGTDGIRFEEPKLVAPSVATGNLRPRAPGYAAAGLRFTLTGSGGLSISVSGTDLRENLADLLPRNHLYVRAGAASLPVNVVLDTTLLADGAHELAAVAYEGSHVRTQTRTTVPVRVENTPLSAACTLLDVPDPAPVGGTYQIQVTANQPAVTAIRLFSTGGELAQTTGQASSTFTLNGATLGAGLHPVYATVEASGGEAYRTTTHWLRLQPDP